MKGQKKLILGLTLLFLGVSSQASASPGGSSCQEKIAAFLSQPTELNLVALSQPRAENCWQLIGPSDAITDRLNRWVGAGNRWAAQYLAKHLSQLDGGNLEDSLVAMGLFSDHDMKQFLIFANEGLLSKYEFISAAGILPLSMSDDAHRQLELLRTRRRAVARVAQKDLTEQKLEALRAIDDSIKSRNRAQDR